MSNIYVNESQIGQTFGPNFNLNSLLSNTVVNRTDDAVVKVQLTTPGVYYLTKAIIFNCNLIIEGCEGVIIAVNYSSINDYQDDAFLQFSKRTMTIDNQIVYGRPNVVIKNVDFRIDNNHFWLPTEPALFYLKFNWAEHIHIENVKMSLSSHPVTNIDIRESENIIIKNCLLENYHNNITETAIGGILWFRGITRNVIITNNIFKKSGNDEILAFWAHFSDYHKSTNPHPYYVIPEEFEPVDGICHKENIIVENNSFVYICYSDYTNNNNNFNINDCLITIYDHADINPNVSPQGEDKFHFENIIFRSNTFIINDFCRRVICGRFEDDTYLKEVSFQNNHIEIGEFHIEDEYLTVFDLSNIFPNIDTKFDISDNTLYNKAHIQIYGTSPGLYFLIQNGGEVTVRNNLTIISNESVYNKMYFIWNKSLNNKTTIENNILEGIFLLATLNSSDSIVDPTDPRVLCSSLIIKNNKIIGDPRIYCNNLMQLNLVIDNNTIITSSPIFGLQNCGRSGKVLFINNHIYSSFGASVFYGSWESATIQASYNMQTLCFANNILEGSSSTPLQYFQQHLTSCSITDENNINL